MVTIQNFLIPTEFGDIHFQSVSADVKSLVHKLGEAQIRIKDIRKLDSIADLDDAWFIQVNDAGFELECMFAVPADADVERLASSISRAFSGKQVQTVQYGSVARIYVDGRLTRDYAAA